MPKQGLFEDWACDVMPSIPGPVPEGFSKVQMGGFCFTDGGICMDISQVQSEAMSHPPYGPKSGRDRSQ